MELKWLDDLVALAEEGSLSKAALRRNTTQPAFTRRIQAIEVWLGSKVLDRSTKPARISAAITRHIEDVRAMSRNVRRLRTDVQNWEQSHRHVSIATQHTLSVTLFPSFVSAFHQAYPQSAIRLRSANRDECFSLLMTGQASVLVAYEAEGFWVSADNALIERAYVRSERLVPIVARSHQQRLLPQNGDGAPLRVIGYPEDVFFGKILASQIWPNLLQSQGLNAVCETALVPAVVGLAREGVGIAWVPESILAHANADDQLLVLNSLPSQDLTVSAMRLKTPRSQTAENVWQALSKFDHGNN
jgi:LysR family transcriptional regulator, hypochlorite-specific transcription factor HypT